MSDTPTHEALRALLAEADHAEAVMLRECGIGVLNRVVLEQARAALAAADAALSVQAEPVAWQWRNKGEPWSMDWTFSHEVHATTDDTEVRALYATPQPPAPVPAVPMSDEERASRHRAAFPWLE